MKRFLTVLAFLLVCFSFVAGAQEVRPVNVTLNGVNVDCALYGQRATIIDGRTMVPLRAIFESLGADVVWDRNTRTVLSAGDGVVVELTVGEKELVKNGNKTEIDVPALIVNNRTLVPARAVAEAFGVYVEWDKDSRTVILTTSDALVPKQRKLKIESPQKDKNAYEVFNFGMTLQECWDVYLSGMGQKKLACGKDGNTEIHISEETEGKKREMQLKFSNDYLYCVCVREDGGEDEVFVDKTADILINGYPVPQQVKTVAEQFGRAFSSFDMRAASLVSTAENSVRRMGIEGRADVVPFTGFDREMLTKKILEDAFDGDEEYKALAETAVNSIEKLIADILARCNFVADNFYGESEKEVSFDLTFDLPDISFVLPAAGEKLEAVMIKALDEALSEYTDIGQQMNEEELVKLFCKVLESSLDEVFSSCLENAPFSEITVGFSAAPVDGEWKIKADAEIINAALEKFRMFE